MTGILWIKKDLYTCFFHWEGWWHTGSKAVEVLGRAVSEYCKVPQSLHLFRRLKLQVALAAFLVLTIFWSDWCTRMWCLYQGMRWFFCRSTYVNSLIFHDVFCSTLLPVDVPPRSPVRLHSFLGALAMMNLGISSSWQFDWWFCFLGNAVWDLQRNYDSYLGPGFSLVLASLGAAVVFLLCIWGWTSFCTAVLEQGLLKSKLQSSAIQGNLCSTSFRSEWLWRTTSSGWAGKSDSYCQDLSSLIQLDSRLSFVHYDFYDLCLFLPHPCLSFFGFGWASTLCNT